MIKYIISNYIDILSISFFFLAWVGYTVFSRIRSKKKTNSLSATLHYYRRDWMFQIIGRDVRIGDMQRINQFENNCIFFASSSLLVIAGILSLFGYASVIAEITQTFLLHITGEKVSLILAILLIIFVYSFFVFTWSMRQFGFSGIMILSAPSPNARKYNKQQKKEFADHTANIIDLAATHFNYGLRAYYFAIAALFWIAGPLALIMATSIVILVLYHREFRSSALKALILAHKDIEMQEDME